MGTSKPSKSSKPQTQSGYDSGSSSFFFSHSPGSRQNKKSKQINLHTTKRNRCKHQTKADSTSISIKFNEFNEIDFQNDIQIDKGDHLIFQDGRKIDQNSSQGLLESYELKRQAYKCKIQQQRTAKKYILFKLYMDFGRDLKKARECIQGQVKPTDFFNAVVSYLKQILTLYLDLMKVLCPGAQKQMRQSILQMATSLYKHKQWMSKKNQTTFYKYLKSVGICEQKYEDEYISNADLCQLCMQINRKSIEESNINHQKQSNITEQCIVLSSQTLRKDILRIFIAKGEGLGVFLQWVPYKVKQNEYLSHFRSMIGQSLTKLRSMMMNANCNEIPAWKSVVKQRLITALQHCREWMTHESQLIFFNLLESIYLPSINTVNSEDLHMLYSQIKSKAIKIEEDCTNTAKPPKENIKIRVQQQQKSSYRQSIIRLFLKHGYNKKIANEHLPKHFHSQDYHLVLKSMILSSLKDVQDRMRLIEPTITHWKGIDKQKLVIPMLHCRQWMTEHSNSAFQQLLINLHLKSTHSQTIHIEDHHIIDLHTQIHAKLKEKSRKIENKQEQIEIEEQMNQNQENQQYLSMRECKFDVSNVFQQQKTNLFDLF